jgi:hypothetical protein
MQKGSAVRNMQGRPTTDERPPLKSIGTTELSHVLELSHPSGIKESRSACKYDIAHLEIVAC